MNPLRSRRPSLSCQIAQSAGGLDEQCTGQVRHHEVERVRSRRTQIGSAQRHVGTAIEREVFFGCEEGVAVVINADNRYGSQSARRNRQHARPGPDVDGRVLPHVQMLKRRQAEPRRRVMRGAETHGGPDHDHDGPRERCTSGLGCAVQLQLAGVRNVPWGRDDDVADPHGAEFGLRFRHPILVRDVQRLHGEVGELAGEVPGGPVTLSGTVEEDPPDVRGRFVDRHDLVTDKRGLQKIGAVRRGGLQPSHPPALARYVLSSEYVLDAIE